MLELKWRTSTRMEAGLYFVAAEYGPATGVFDFIEWDGEKWDTYPTVEIIGYLGLHEFKDQLTIKWPREVSIAHVRQALTDEDMDYKEM